MIAAKREVPTVTKSDKINIGVRIYSEQKHDISETLYASIISDWLYHSLNIEAKKVT
jgi:hypothetical protein